MSRQQLENVIRQRLYGAAPELTSWMAGQLIKSEPFQRWLDSIERRRPRGIVAWWRRTFGRRQGLTPEQEQKLEELVQKAMERFGR